MQGAYRAVRLDPTASGSSCANPPTQPLNLAGLHKIDDRVATSDRPEQNSYGTQKLVPWDGGSSSYDQHCTQYTKYGEKSVGAVGYMGITQLVSVACPIFHLCLLPPASSLRSLHANSSQYHRLHSYATRSVMSQIQKTGCRTVHCVLHRIHVTLLRVLVFPDLFFAERTPRRGVAGRVVAAVAILQAVLTVALTGLFAVRVAMLSDTTDLAGAFNLVHPATFGDAVSIGVLVIVNWLLVGLLLHALTWYLDSGGTVGETLYVVGWSSPVTLLSPLLAGFVIALSHPGTQPWKGAGDQLAVLVGTAMGVALFVGLLGLCWQGYIWIAGLQATHDISRETASKASVGTVVLVGLFTLILLG